MDDLHLLLMDESFQRWLSGRASKEEEKKWEHWLLTSPDAPSLHEQALTIWEWTQYKSVDVPDVDMEWKKLKITLRHQKQRLRPAHSFGYSFSKLFKLKKGAYKHQWRKTGVLVFASVVIISLLIGKYVINTVGQEQVRVVTTSYGQRNILTFLDGTRIILNASSRLEYPAEWKANAEKRVVLTGEAFFKVADMSSNPSNKFIVQTEDGLIKVVGTKFAVYKRGNKTRVAVEKGRVEVSSMRQAIVGNEHVVMHPNQLLVFQKENRELVPQDVNIKPYTTWWQEEYILDRTPFHEIVSRIEETYGVTVSVRKPELLNRTLSGSFGNESLTDITTALGKALNVEVQWKDKTIIFGG